jgi:hypothetical protein
MNPLLLNSEKSHIFVDILFVGFGCIKFTECSKWLIGGLLFAKLDDAPRVAAGHLLKYKCTSWAEE